MKDRQVGNSEVKAAAVAFGAWSIGGEEWGSSDEKTAISTIHAAIANGINLIDTAPIYSRGVSETVVGKAIAGKRNQVILSSKCGLRWDSEEGDFFFAKADGVKIYRNLSAKNIKYECEQSLKRLNTDYIDIYFTHWQSENFAREETMTALMDLKREGKILAIGASNFDSVKQLEEYQQYGELSIGQEQYNLLHRDIESELLPACRAKQVSMMAYCPLAQGLLTGKMGPERVFEPDDRRADVASYSVDNRTKVMNMLTECQPMADNHGISLAQLIIAWTIAQPGLTFALCGARTPEQAEQNAKAGNIQLTAEEVAQIAGIAAHHNIAYDFIS